MQPDHPEPRAESRAEPRVRLARELPVVAAVALLLALVWTWPLATWMGERLPYDPRATTEDGSDQHLWVWGAWWAREALERGRNPFFCDRIFHPDGHTLVFHTHGMLWAIASIPLQWIGGLLFSINALILLGLTASATAVYTLARSIGAGRAGSGLAGFAWAFSPYFMQKGLYHLCFFASPFPALFLLGMLRWANGPPRGRRTLLAAAGAGVAGGLCVLTSSIVSIYIAFSGLLAWLVAPSVEPGARRGARSGMRSPLAWLVALAAAGLVASPYLVELSRRLDSMERVDAPQTYRALPSDFVTLPTLHPLRADDPVWEPRDWYDHDSLRVEDSGLYLGWSVLLLVGFAAVAVPRARRWLLVALPLFVLAWDPGPYPAGWLSSLYRELPFLGAIRYPARGFPIALLPIVVVAGLGLDALVARPRLRPLAGLAVLLLAFEFQIRSYPSMEPPVPAPVRALAEAPGDGALLVLPYQRESRTPVWWQTVHEKPVVTSFVARLDREQLRRRMEEQPHLYMLTVPEVDPETGLVAVPAPADLARDLDAFEARHLFLREDRVFNPAVVEQLRTLFDSLEGWSRRMEADGVTWWSRDAP